MITTIPTPRTDEAVYVIKNYGAHPPQDWPMVKADLARTLERELACEREKVRALRGALSAILGDPKEFDFEYHEAQPPQEFSRPDLAMGHRALAATEEKL